MKKFLSVLLAVMMVLSTVSFAAPSLAGVAETAVETPVAPEAAPEEAANLAAEATIDEFGTLLAEVNFNSAELGAIDFGSNGLTVAALGGSVTSASAVNVASARVTNGSGDNYPAMGAEIKERAAGDNYLELTTNADAAKNLIQFYTGAAATYFTTEDGYLTVTFDVNYGASAAEGKYHDVVYNRSQAAEIKDQSVITLAAENGGWGRVVSSFDEEIGMSGIGGNSQTMLPYEVNYIKLHSASGVVAGETFGIDNIRVYYRPKTVDVTLYVDGVNDVVLSGYDTLGTSMAELEAMLPAVEGKVLVGFSLEPNGELLTTTKFASDCTVYPVYEERVALEGSLEFDSASDSSRYSLRTGKNNALGADMAEIADGVLKVTYTGTDTTQVVQDTGMNLNGINFPADALTNIEFKVRFTGMPESDATLNQAGSGTTSYKVASVEWPEIYYTTGGTLIHGTGFTTDLTGKNGEWMTFNYSVEELGITDLTSFRFDFYNFMPHGSTLEIDYIRFIGKPVRVTVDNGDNTTAPEVVMDVTAETTVAEVAAKYAKDHGDMKFVGLSRTAGGAVLADTELVSADGTSTTLYAIWDNYEYLTKYSVNFDEEADVTSKIRITQNSDGVDGNSTYGTTYFWNEEGGYLTLKAIAADGYQATWDHQVFVETFSPETALPAGVVSEIAVRMRYRNIPSEKTTYTISGRSDTAFNPVKADSWVHIAKYGATAWGELLQSNNRYDENLVDGEWFTRYLDAETYFAEGLAYVRFDTTFPMPDGAEVDIDYIRFLGDNENENIPGSEFLGEYGERVWTIDFDDATTGAYANSSQASTLGIEENTWLSTATSGIRFSTGGTTAPTVAIAEKSATDKYFTYTLNAANTSSYFFFSAGTEEFVAEDGYFVVTFDYKSDVEAPFTFRINRHDEIEDQAEHFRVIEKGEWDTVVLYYDKEIGSAVRSGVTSIASTNEISIVKWHPVSGSEVGQTVAIDNFTLWYVPKTVEVTVDLAAYGKDNVVIKDYPTTGMDRIALEKALPAVENREIVGLSLVNGGEALYENRIAYNATLYPVYEKVNILEGSYEFNDEADLNRVLNTSVSQARLGKNNAKTTVAEQFVLESDSDASYLHVDIASAEGETGCVVDFGFIMDKMSFAASEVNEMVIKLRVNDLPATSTKYTCGTHCTNGHTLNPANITYLELVYWDNDSSALKQVYISADLTAVDGEWFTYTVSGADMPYTNIKQLRFDPFGDYAPHGASMDVDYIRFYGEPEPDAEKRAYSADFDTDATGVSLVSWKKEDGTYMYDDGVNGDKGPGIGSAYISDGAEGYITWNEEGYVTLNFDANDEVKAAAEAQGATAAVYDPSVYVAALDGAKKIPAGTFTEMKIRMRLRGLPADGTAIYGQNYGGYASATFSMDTYPVYFHWMNSADAVLYDGVQSKQLDDTCTFTQGSYVADQWFEVTIPASFFEADVEDLATLRINLPDWTPDGTKIDIDYIHFYGDPIVATAPTSADVAELRIDETVDDDATDKGSNGIRFKAAVDASTSESSADIGWVVVSYDKFMADGTQSYENLAVDTTGAKVGYKKLDGEDITNFFDTSDDNALVFTAVLYGIPEAYFESYVIARPFVCVDGEYLYGTAISTSLYDEAVAIYEDADAFDSLTTEQQDYIIYVLDTVEL